MYADTSSGRSSGSDGYMDGYVSTGQRVMTIITDKTLL